MHRTHIILAALAAATAAPASAADIRHVSAGQGRPFSAATEVGGILYLSGQIGTRPDGTLAEGFEAQSVQVMDNIAAVLKGEGLGMDDVFKCTVMLADMSRWPDFNRIYVRYFKPDRLPARSALGANGLAMGAAVEVECMAQAR